MALYRYACCGAIATHPELFVRPVVRASLSQESARAAFAGGSWLLADAGREILVWDHASVSPAEIRGAIQNALERHADREVSRSRSTSSVTLHGNVDSWGQRQAVIGAAWGTRGVDKVVDQMRIA